MLSKYARISAWLRQSNSSDNADSLVTRCCVAANTIDDLEARLKASENEISKLELRILEAQIDRNKRGTILERIINYARVGNT